MSSDRENSQTRFVILSKACSGPCLRVIALLLLVSWPASLARAQSSAGAPAQSETPSQNQSQTPAQTESQPDAAAQTDSEDTQQSLGDAARKANAQKSKAKSKHVFTEDDLSSIGGGISVVGNGSSGGNSAERGNSGAGLQGGNAASGTSRDEAYWRGRAREIRNQIAQVDQQIDRVKSEIATGGPNGFDATTGLSQGVIIVHDRNSELKQYEDRKKSLEAQLDDLADEARKAGADSGWVR
jgi:hypothetical protein